MMATTPPAQIRGEAHTPPTPLHGSAYHSTSPSSRYFTRSTMRNTPDAAHSSSLHTPRAARTPHSPRQQSDLHFHSPNITHASATPRRKAARRTHIISPASPDSEHSEHPLPKPLPFSATTVLSEGMLPTPAKTPQKKPLPKSAMAARALFQDLPDVDYTSRLQRKKVRHNGFSLESFAEKSADGDISIHVDSRDQLPEIDTSASNPFYDAAWAPSLPSSMSRKRSAPASTQKASTVAKRRRVAADPTQVDAQVRRAIDNDEGMVYVFRGKKVYRRFDDAGDEEEVIDPEELGLLQYQPAGTEIVRPLKTLTRKSIQPKRLFQPEPSSVAQDDDVDTELEETKITEVEPSSPTRLSRSRAAKASARELSPAVSPVSTNDPIAAITAGSKRKRGSPFDKWPRLKSGSRSVSGDTPIGATGSRSRKRTAAEALEV